ncbi:MAG: ActS/PrrB/RegB family redox-sensitive histidine kinase [Azospirillaceae bacterium]|nr:ActS/PrrB/RegB family redox-sensitive histidine kinase [Azospirillaceae bacterium]
MSEFTLPFGLGRIPAADWMPWSRSVSTHHPQPLQIDGRVTLRTLILIRWVAITGQTIAILTVRFGLGLALPLGPMLAAIGASVALNGLALAQRGARPRLSDRDAALYLGYDTLQLSLLLFLSGGLQNPFALLMLSPLTVAAAILTRRSVIVLTSLAVVCLTALSLWSFPLPWPDGPLTLPPLFAIGIWIALTLSAVFITAYVWSVAREARRISDALAASQIALSREQKLSALGALAAAAAHELGTPLGTIALVAKELSREIPKDSPFAEDIALLQSQSGRCRQILADLARKPETEGGEPYDRLTLGALIDAAAGAYRNNDIAFNVTVEQSGSDTEPMIRRSPEIIHGLGNLLANAIQFARTWVDVCVTWDGEAVVVTVIDDGPGFPATVLNRLGEPYISTRAETTGHMGLGIFIAQTLLERTGAEVAFSNNHSGGAQVVVRWSRPILEWNAG